MLNTVGRWLNVHEDEIRLFFWTAVLLFLVRISGILLNNYAETAFLKRYGVEFLPIVSMLNAVATFVIMGALTGFMTRMPGARLLTRIFIFCGLSMAGLRFLIPLGYDLIYPLMFMLKAQYEVLLALLFWNLANDMFNTRQSKRLFPLITAGGVIGQIIGSFATPWIARVMMLDNLLFAYLGTTLLGAMVVKQMGSRFPTLLFQQSEKNVKKKRTSMIEEFKTVAPIMKGSTLVKILILLTLLPNIVIPIMNYQFNYAVSEQYVTETSLIEFFGYFRGVLNIISLVILLFIGKLYDRFGLPVALMFHPFNYMLVFFTFLLRFDAIAAIYARMSSNIIRTTINIPATAVVTGLFPESYRALVRPFLRGTVVRIGLFVGSGMILLSENLFHPRYLSLVALPFVMAWAVTPFVFKKKYSGILLDLVGENMIDIRSMEKKDLGHIFGDKKIQDHLIQTFRSASGKSRIWYGRILQSLDIDGFDNHILSCLKTETDDKTRIGLVHLLSKSVGEPVARFFQELASPDNPELTIEMIKVGNRNSSGHFHPFNKQILASGYPIEIQAYAVAGLYHQDPDVYGAMIEKWLAADSKDKLKAGIIATGESGSKTFSSRLKKILDRHDDESLLPFILQSLYQTAESDINPVVSDFLSHKKAPVRRQALVAFDIRDEASLKRAVMVMGDKSAKISALAKEKIKNAQYQNPQAMVESLALPSRKTKEGIFDLLESMNIKDLDVVRFIRLQAQQSFQLLSDLKAVDIFDECNTRGILKDHLNQQIQLKMETIIRVLAAQDRTDDMQLIYRGLFSKDRRQNANSLEALDDILTSSLSGIIIPLLDEGDMDQKIATGQKLFDLASPGNDPESVQSYFLESDDWITVLLVQSLIFRECKKKQEPVSGETPSEKTKTLSVVQCDKESGMETQLSLTQKILHLKKIEIFEDLAINELAAVASITDEITYPEGQTVFKEGDIGDTLFMIIEGEVSVIKDHGHEKEIELDRILSGDYFGEMALFDDEVRSATIRTEKESRCLTLHKYELQEIVREYPAIALHACKVLSWRIRRLHKKVLSKEKMVGGENE